MPSGWGNSGIDWSSVEGIRKSRTEDVIRELYLAVNERDYWIRSFTKGSTLAGFYSHLALPDLDRTGRMRMENQYKYIYDNVKLWLTPFDDLPVGFYGLTNQSCFLDETSSMNPLEENFNNRYKPFLPQGRWYNLRNLDYSLWGTLEDMVSYDMAILRSGTINTRIDLGFVKFVYDLLNLDLKISNCLSQKTIPQSNNEFSNGESSFLGIDTEGYFGFFRTKVASVDWSNIIDAPTELAQLVTDFENASYGDFVYKRYLGSLQIIDQFQRGSAGGNTALSDRQSYIGFDSIGFDNNPIDMNQMDIKLYSFGFLLRQDSSDDFIDYFPQANKGLGDFIDSPSVVNINGKDVVTNSATINDTLTVVPVPPIPPAFQTTSINDKFYDFTVMPFVNISSQAGFLNYYTPSTN